MRHIVLSCLGSLAPPYFSTLPHKRHDFRNKLLNIKFVFWFSLQLLFKIILNLRRILQDIVINVKTSSCKVLVILVTFLQNLNFLDSPSEKTKISNLIKIRPSGSRVVPCGRTNRRRETTKLRVAFHNFANARKKRMKERKAYFNNKVTKWVNLRVYMPCPLAWFRF